MKTLRQADMCCVNLALTAMKELLTGTQDARGSVLNTSCIFHHECTALILVMGRCLDILSCRIVSFVVVNFDKFSNYTMLIYPSEANS